MSGFNLQVQHTKVEWKGDETDSPPWGLDRIDPLPAQKQRKPRTSFKIVGLNNFSMLPQMEPDRLVAEWCRLVGREVSAQVAQKPQGGRPKGGESEAARQLGLDRDDVRRASKVASITPEAQQAAHEVGHKRGTKVSCPLVQQAAHEVGNRWATKSKQLQASASRWGQMVGIWWASPIPARQIVSQKMA